MENKTLEEWLDHFRSGDCHTDYAADQRNGQENIIEFLEDYLGEPKLTLCCRAEYDEDIARCPECKENV